jgi:integrase
MFRRAVEWKYLSRPPWTQSPKLKVRDAKPRRFLTLDEIERLIAASKESRNKRLYYFVMIAVYTGMRLGEIMTLEWQQIDFESKLIHIINKPDKGFTTKSLKERSIGIHPRLYEALQEFFLKRHELVSYPGQARQKDHNYLFPSPYRAGKKQFPYRCAFWQAMARAKIENASLHSLRHTFASQLLMNGGNLKDCQEILGHRDISTTANIYAHLSPERKIDIISKLPY